MAGSLNGHVAELDEDTDLIEIEGDEETGPVSKNAQIMSARLTITGERPLFWHAFTKDTIPADGKKERTGVAGHDPEEWKRSVLMTQARQLYIPANYIFGCLRDGGKYTARKRSTLMSYIAGTLEVLDAKILLNRFVPDWEGMTEKERAISMFDEDAPVYVDVRSVRNPATKARNVRYRVACSAPWELTAHIMWDRTIISRNEMASVATDAGNYIGLGDARSIGKGRFTVTGLEFFDGVPEEIKKAAAASGKIR